MVKSGTTSGQLDILISLSVRLTFGQMYAHVDASVIKSGTTSGQLRQLVSI